MIRNDTELEATLERIKLFYTYVMRIRQVESSPTNYRASAGGFLIEIDRMNLEVREYLFRHTSEMLELQKAG